MKRIQSPSLVQPTGFIEESGLSDLMMSNTIYKYDYVEGGNSIKLEADLFEHTVLMWR